MNNFKDNFPEGDYLNEQLQILQHRIVKKVFKHHPSLQADILGGIIEYSQATARKILFENNDIEKSEKERIEIPSAILDDDMKEILENVSDLFNYVNEKKIFIVEDFFSLLKTFIYDVNEEIEMIVNYSDFTSDIISEKIGIKKMDENFVKLIDSKFKSRHDENSYSFIVITKDNYESIKSSLEEESKKLNHLIKLEIFPIINKVVEMNEVDFKDSDEFTGLLLRIVNKDKILASSGVIKDATSALNYVKRAIEHYNLEDLEEDYIAESFGNL